ncbi:MAG TPA: hypothetical protein ENI23_11210 [bacterium]|nr:hypothetical protein [bacterium]
MAATITNKALTTANLTNVPLSGTSRPWELQDYIWNNASGDWNNPYQFTNISLNTGSITNNSLS